MSITDKILSAVSNTIWNEFHTDFGDDMVISKGDIPQNLKPNSFTIKCINPIVNRDLGRLYKTNFTISICFFPDISISQTKINESFYDVIERLDSILEILKVSNELSILGTDIDRTISDENVLVYVISFNTRMLEEKDEEEMMKELIIKQGVK